jgi:hypothetical protein
MPPHHYPINTWYGDTLEEAERASAASSDGVVQVHGFPGAYVPRHGTHARGFRASPGAITTASAYARSAT